MIQVLDRHVVDVHKGSADYFRFVQMSETELSDLQTSYYSELHRLQNEFDALLEELRAFVLKKNALLKTSNPADRSLLAIAQ